MNTTVYGVIGGLVVGGLLGYTMAPKSSAPNNTQTAAASAFNTPEVTAAQGTDEWKVQDAMSAAPASVSNDATVMDWPGADGKLAELKKGTNGWTCLPDSPQTPKNDPICVNGPALEWFQAYMGKKTPTNTQPGLGYMLQGGDDPSNTDPFATEPKAGEDWMDAPPHIMIFPTGKLDTKVFGTAMNGGPWIMWANTPYAHLMMPVK